MKKIKSLFVRDFFNKACPATSEITPGCEWVVAGEGVATEKFDGSAARVTLEDGVHRVWKRYDCKKGKTPPPDFEPCESEPDAKGHWPGWVPLREDNPEDKWFIEGAHNSFAMVIGDVSGTYELIGPKVQGNPYGGPRHMLVRHGCIEYPDAPRDFEGLRVWLADHSIEGLVWHHPDGRMAKVKRKDFGFDWPLKKEDK